MTATDKDGGVSEPAIHTSNVIQPVEINVKPGSETNPINLSANGVIPITIFTTADFNASWVDLSTVQFEGADVPHWAFEDIDGDLDLVLHFRLDETSCPKSVTATPSYVINRHGFSSRTNGSGTNTGSPPCPRERWNRSWWR